MYVFKDVYDKCIFPVYIIVYICVYEYIYISCRQMYCNLSLCVFTRFLRRLTILDASTLDMKNP